MASFWYGTRWHSTKAPMQSAAALSGATCQVMLQEQYDYRTFGCYAESERWNANFLREFTALAEDAGHAVAVGSVVKLGPRVKEGSTTAEMMLSCAPVLNAAELEAIRTRMRSNIAAEDDKWRHYTDSYKRAWCLDSIDADFLARHGTLADCPRTQMLARVLCPDMRRPPDEDNDIEEKRNFLKVHLVSQVIDALGLKSPFDCETVIPDLMKLFTERLKFTDMFKDYTRTSRLFRSASTGVAKWELKTVVKAVNMVLNATGLSLAGTTVRVQVKKQRSATTSYRLYSADVAEMTEQVKLHLRGAFCHPSNAHARAALEACTLPMYGHLIDDAASQLPP
jgi:hypothetical protein